MLLSLVWLWFGLFWFWFVLCFGLFLGGGGGEGSIYVCLSKCARSSFLLLLVRYSNLSDYPDLESEQVDNLTDIALRALEKEQSFTERRI